MIINNNNIVLKNNKLLEYNSLDQIVIDYISGMTNQPSLEHIRLINEFVRKTKTIITNKADVMYLGNINDSNDSFRNIVKNAHHGTKQGSGLVWDEYYGYSNPNATGYVDTNYNPSTQSVYFTKNDCSVCIYIGSNDGNYNGKYPFGAWVSNTALFELEQYNINGFRASLNCDYFNCANLPFIAGVHCVRRTASNVSSYINQNLTNITNTNVSNTVPNTNIHIFRSNGVTSSEYTSLLNLFYIGLSLTNAEFKILNDSYNDYLIQCLFLKYGKDNWGVKMAKSYFLELHNFEKYEAFEVYEFIKRHQPNYTTDSTTGYTYYTFSGSTNADYIMLFKSGGNLVTNTWVKTGNSLRWNQSGIITTGNTMPAYTRNAMLGIITVTSTDGWNGVTSLIVTQQSSPINSFFGNFPLIRKLKTGGAKMLLNTNINKLKINYRGFNISAYVLGSRNESITYPGYVKANVSDMVGGIFTNTIYFFGSGINSASNISGDVTPWVNEISETTTSFIFGLDTNITGSLENIAFPNATQSINIGNTSIVKGFRHWRTSITNVLLVNNAFPTSEVDEFLAFLNTFYTTNTPTANLTLDLSGNNMGIPTGGANNTDLLGIVAKFTSASKTATITVRTS